MNSVQLLSSLVNDNDINDEAKNENYSREIKNLYNEILEDLSNIDDNKTGYVSEQDLLHFLQNKLPPGKQLNTYLFQQLLQDIERNIDNNISLEDFCTKYIKAHEELKVNYETLQKGIDKEKNEKNIIESKIQEVRQERVNQNGISQNSRISTIIGDITFLSQINCESIYFIVSLDDNKEHKTSSQSIDNPTFLEKIEFPIQDKQSTLSYKLFSDETNQFIGCTDVPLNLINTDNEEIMPQFELKDDSNQVIAVFKPKIIIVTSYFEMYQKKYENIDKNIDSYQTKIKDLKQNLDDISLPYKKNFEKFEKILISGPLLSNNDDQLVKGVEGILSNLFKDKKVKWIISLKIILYFNIFILLFTTLVKSDFISLFICFILLLIFNTEKYNYFFEHFDKILIGILIMIAYDIMDYLFLRKYTVDNMSAVDGWGKFFGFLGFLGKIGLLLMSFIIKTKFGKIGTIPE